MFQTKKDRIEKILSTSLPLLSKILMIEKLIWEKVDKEVYIEKSDISGSSQWRLSEKLMDLLKSPTSIKVMNIDENLYIQATYSKIGVVGVSSVGMKGYIGDIAYFRSAPKKFYVCPNSIIINDIKMYRVYL